MEQWQDELLGIMKAAGANSEVRFLEGALTSVTPMRFKPDVGTESIGAVYMQHVVDGAAVNDRVLAIEDTRTRRIYVIGRVV